MRQSQRKHLYAAHRIIHGGTERILADLAGTASTAPSGTAAGPSAADSTHPATVARELGQGLHKDPTETEDE